jgi:formate hydrogenlyase subunit 3/multisubunit Na+/H+ antiporter MnhD subunit
MNANEINSIGLVFDIIGVLLLFKFGLPSEISKTGSIGLSLEGTDYEEVKKWKKYNFWSKIGLLFILIGFVFQLYSNY